MAKQVATVWWRAIPRGELEKPGRPEADLGLASLRTQLLFSGLAPREISEVDITRFRNPKLKELQFLTIRFLQLLTACKARPGSLTDDSR